GIRDFHVTGVQTCALPISRLRMNDEEFFMFCQLNPELRIERSSGGDIIVMAPTGGKTGRRNARLIAAFVNWAEKDGSGQFFDSRSEERREGKSVGVGEGSE